MRIGVLGGSFNPIHIGHLNTAQEVAGLLNMDRIYFTVSAQPPHKTTDSLIDGDHRYRMVELAVQDNPLFFPSRIELDREGPSYTIDTMRHFRDKFGGDIYFIVGQDAMEDVGSWKSAATLLKTFNFVVTTRPGHDSSALLDVLQSVLDIKYNNVKLKSIGKTRNGPYETIKVAGASAVIELVNVTPLDISSSMIRARVRRGDTIKYLVPAAVERYLIEEKVIPV